MTGQTPWCTCPLTQPCTCGLEAAVVRDATTPTGWRVALMDHEHGETP